MTILMLVAPETNNEQLFQPLKTWRGISFLLLKASNNNTTIISTVLSQVFYFGGLSWRWHTQVYTRLIHVYCRTSLMMMKMLIQYFLLSLSDYLLLFEHSRSDEQKEIVQFPQVSAQSRKSLDHNVNTDSDVDTYFLSNWFLWKKALSLVS